MQCPHRNLLAALLLSLLAVTLSPAAFINNDTTGMDVIVDFNDQPSSPIGSELTSTPVQIYADGTLTIHMAATNHNVFGNTVRYGVNQLLDGLEATDPYLLLPDASAAAPSFQMGIEFQIAGGAVSAIGIHLSAIAGLSGTLTDITLAIYDGDGIELESFTITNSSTPVNLSGLFAPGNDPSLGGFYGFSTGENNIVSFRITGGYLALDDLKLRTLDDPGSGDPGDGDPLPNPAAVPEPGTFLLCGSLLGLLALAARRKVFTSFPRR
jgi:hypothetical protein